MAGNSDDTVILNRRGRKPWPVRKFWLGGLLLAAVLLIGGGALWWRMPGVAPVSVAGETIVTADEATIGAEQPTALTMLRFAPNPAILVLDFPTLAEQGRMLNRVAALVEKSGAPHDRLLDDAELDAAIRRGGDTPDTYYYGHDYRGGDILRFFALADRDHVALNPDELRLRRLAAQAGGEPFGFGALISLPRAEGANGVDHSARVAILHHELSHGEYFTDDSYARFVATMWHGVLTEDERAKFRRYLGSEAYDTTIEDLMINEMQAYLMHTPDLRFFDPARLGIGSARLAELRATFAAGMPSCWLRAETPGVVK